MGAGVDGGTSTPGAGAWFEATTAGANMGSTGGLQATADATMEQITGIIVVSAPGNLELWHSSETATATTVEVGSSLVVIRTA